MRRDPQRRIPAALTSVARDFSLRRLHPIFPALLMAFLFFYAQSGAAESSTPQCTLGLHFDNAITSGTLDYLQRGLAQAAARNCASVLIEINTPGGSLEATRSIVELILSSPRPILCLITPPGGHAGSAGAIIMMACHVSGAEMATNIGAATPISAQGDLAHDLRKKVMEDTESWARGLAKLRGRNADFAGAMIAQAKSLEAEEAVKIGAIDLLVHRPAEFLQAAAHRKVALSGGTEVEVQVGPLMNYEPNVRDAFLQIVTDPEIAYLLFMGSLALLFFELTHPGMVAPGVAGLIALIISFMAFQKLGVSWGGVLLILCGAGLLVAEAFLPSLGALGVGGLVAFAAGSVLLYDPGTSGYELPLSLTLATSALIGLSMLGLSTLAYRTRKKGLADLEKLLVGHRGRVVSVEPRDPEGAVISPSKGIILIRGELWSFVCDRPIAVDCEALVLSQTGLRVQIKEV
jgi:membrane-bound serine protease (ClpP class)